MKNKVYKVLSEWKLDNLKEKFKSKEICILTCIRMYIVNNNINKIKKFNIKYIYFHFANYDSYVFK